MKRYWFIIKQEAKEWITDNWYSEYYFDKGKVVFVGIVLLLTIIKLIYNLFA